MVEADVARQCRGRGPWCEPLVRCEDFRKARLAVAEMVAEALNSAETRQKSSGELRERAIRSNEKP